jgi:hypothetical protein
MMIVIVKGSGSATPSADRTDGQVRYYRAIVDAGMAADRSEHIDWLTPWRNVLSSLRASNGRTLN